MIFSEKTKTQPISKEQVWAAWLRVRSHHRCYPTLFIHWQYGLTG